MYNFKEYKAIFDTPMKKQQELAVARKIMDLLNKNKYDNLEEFISKNNNYQDFLKKNNMNTVIKHFGNTLKEEDYVKILENLRILTKTKKDFEKDNIKTTTINDKQFNSFKGENKTYFIDNSRTNKTIEDQMKDLQVTEQKFQSTDQNKNTENMFKELETKKETLNLNYLNQINYDLLSNEEKMIFQVAFDYQQTLGSPIKLDIKKELIVDENDNILKIEKIDGLYSIIKNENGIQKEEIQQKTFQKTLTPRPNTIYYN